MQKPKLRSHYHPEPLPDENVVLLLSEKGHSVLSGEAYVHLIPYMTGQYTVQEIVQSLNGKVPFMQVQYAISMLKQRGFITEAQDALPPAQEAFWNLLEIEAETALTRQGGARVAVHAMGDTDAGPLQDLLGTVGLAVTTDDADFSVVVTDDYMRPALEDLGARFYAQGQPWMVVKPNGVYTWVGPILRGDDTACWACLTQRIRANREVDTFLQEKKALRDPFPVARAQLPTTTMTTLNMAANAIAHYVVAGEHPSLVGRIMEIDQRTGETSFHYVVKQPQCPVCGDPDAYIEQARQPVQLQSRPKHFTADGGHRALTPEQMLERYEHHVSPITGVIYYLGLRTAESGLVYIYDAANNFAFRHDRWATLRNSMLQRSAGKGMTQTQAKASGLGEGIERYCGLYRPVDKAVARQATYHELGDAAIDPVVLFQFSERQFETAEHWSKISPRHVVPAPFDPDKTIDWTPVWSLTEDRVKYVPTAFAYYGYWEPERFHEAFCWADSNGCASGSNLEEAVLQGFMEAIERDNIAIWWYNRLQRPRVDLASFQDPYFDRLLAFYEGLGRDTWVIDITNDLGIPTFAAVSRRRAEKEQLCVGYGSHFDARIAIARALTEINEMYSAFPQIIDMEASTHDQSDGEITSWMQNATVKEHYYLMPDDTLPPKTKADYPRLWQDDLRDDILRGVEILQAHGIETLVLDQTRPDVGMGVARVIAPGLRHFWARFGPGRLYDVPVQLGWLDEPTPEEDLNPIPMFF